MQPDWREGESLVKTLPADTDWGAIYRGGSNGLFLVVMALSWWVGAMGPNDQHNLDLLVAIYDVKWVLSELAEKLSAFSMKTEKKHLLEEATKNEQSSKRLVQFQLNFIVIYN
jgi:hypothetical protein